MTEITSMKEAIEQKLAKIEADNRRKVEEMERTLPHTVEVRQEPFLCGIARRWCEDRFGEARMRVGVSAGVWSCAEYMSYIPYRTFRFADDKHAIEFKLMFG